MFKAVVLCADDALKWQTKSPDREEDKRSGLAVSFNFPFEAKIIQSNCLMFNNRLVLLFRERG